MINNQLKSFIKAKREDYIVPIIDACENNGEWSEAYPIGFSQLDEAMRIKGQERGGVRDGDLVVITGISGSGKTTFAQNITKNFSDKIKMPCLWFSYEVIVDNLVAKFEDLKVKVKNKEALVFAPKKIKSVDLKWIKDMIKESQEKYNVKMIFIDHIDFLKAHDFSKESQRRIVLRDICQELKNIARELKVIIFLMAHVKKVQGREVEMQDISESSGIFQLADFVFSVSRYYNVKIVNDREVKVASNEGVIKLLKNRLTGKLFFENFEMKDNIIISI